MVYVVYDKRSDWEIDYIRNDILHCVNNATFLYLSRDELKTVETDHPQVVKNNILVFSSNNYLFKDVLRIVKAIKPKIIVQLSDEQGRKEMFNNLSRHTKLYLRNYNYAHYPVFDNIKQFPLGYLSGYLNNTYSLEIQKTQRPFNERPNAWAFVGKLKQDRQKMIRVFEHLTPHKCLTDGNVSRSDMFEIYSQSIFVPCGRGNMRLECYRLYEVLLAGAIPVVVGSKEEVAETFLYNPPFIFESSWEEALKRCRALLGSDELRKIQESIQGWWKSNMENIHLRIANVL